MAKLGVEVTKAQLEHAAEVADVITGNKVQKKIVAGTGATLTPNQDGTETLNLTGGGGGGGSYSAGNGIIIDTNIISALTALRFVETLPTANINEGFTYLIKDDKLFPDASSYITSTYPYIAVAYQADAISNKWRLVQFKTQDVYSWYYSGPPDAILSRDYAVYGLNATNDGWVLIEETTGKGWADYVNPKFNSNITIYYSNSKFRNDMGESPKYDPANNICDIYGSPIDQSQVNPYKWIGHQYKNNTWVELGKSDFTELFESIKAAVEQAQEDILTKQPKNKVFSNITVPTSAWTEEQTPTYADFPYKAEITCTGVSANDFARVYFSEEDAAGGNFCTDCITSANTVAIFAAEAPASVITINSIIVEVTI